MSTHSSDPGTICSRHGPVCLDDLSHRGSTSDLILRVQDVQGREYVLKHVGSELGEPEVRALQVWQVSGVTPRLIAELEPGYDLIEWMEGPWRRSHGTSPCRQWILGRRLLPCTACLLPTKLQTSALALPSHLRRAGSFFHHRSLVSPIGWRRGSSTTKLTNRSSSTV